MGWIVKLNGTVPYIYIYIFYWRWYRIISIRHVLMRSVIEMVCEEPEEPEEIGPDYEYLSASIG